MSTYNTQFLIGLYRAELHDNLRSALEEYIQDRLLGQETRLTDLLEDYLTELEVEIDNSVDSFVENNGIEADLVEYATVTVEDDESDEDSLDVNITVEQVDEEVEATKKSNLAELAKILNGLELTVADKLAILNIAKKGE